MTAPFVIDLGFSRNDYATIVKGVGLAATLIGGFRRRLRGAALFAGREPVDRRRAAGDRQSVVLLAGAGRRQPMGAGLRDHRGEFHQRHRHRDLRRLSVGAVPKSAAHRDAICAAHGALPRSGAPICRQAPAMSPRPPAGRCSSSICVLVAVPSLILLAWLQRRGHFADSGSEGDLKPAMPDHCFTTLHLVTTASVIWPASCAQATSSTFTETSLPTKFRNCACLRVAVGDDLKGFRSGFETAQTVRPRQPARLAGELVGGDALAASCRRGPSWR